MYGSKALFFKHRLTDPAAHVPIYSRVRVTFQSTESLASGKGGKEPVTT